MTLRVRFTAALAALLLPLAVAGCGAGHDHDHEAASGASPDEEAAATLPSGRVAIPPAVRANLGISFVAVERRRIESTLRVPGRFEYLPTARREYRTMLPGRVELRVDELQPVSSGDLLYVIDSPAWRALQQELTDAGATIERLQTRLASFGPLRDAHHAHEAQLGKTIAIRKERVAQLEALVAAGGGRRQELIAALDSVSTAEAELSETLEKEATLEADEAEARSRLAAARSTRALLLDTAASLLRIDRATLLATVEGPEEPQPRWRTIDRIEVTAEADGIVESVGLTDGAWATEEAAVLTVVRPDRLRFRASGLQSDLGVLRDGLAARIVPPTPTATGRAVPLDATMAGTLVLGLAGDPRERTVELFVTPESLRPWARPGVSAQLEIVTDATATAELAVPLAAIQRDGLEPVLFRRDPANPNEALRIDADLGADDGRWVALLSGVRAGDEVVLDGAFQLLLATSGSRQQGGHFHADGTFHAEDH